MAGQDYLTFIGSDFIKEGQRVAEWLVKNAGGKTKIIELEGTTGSSPANDRKKGFDEAIQGGRRASRSSHRSPAILLATRGRQVAESLLQAHPDANVIYAHNDEMAIGAISAIEAAGKVPGKDILVLSIDGGKEAVGLVAEGKIAAVVECKTALGPKAFETMAATPRARRSSPGSSTKTSLRQLQCQGRARQRLLIADRRPARPPPRGRGGGFEPASLRARRL